MKKYAKIVAALLVVILFGSGCCSYMVLDGSKKAIRARKLGTNTAGIGIDLTNIEALMDRPLLQLGAAIIDAGILYAGYEGYGSLDEKSDSDVARGNVISGNNNDVVIIQGNDNDSNADYEPTTSN